MSKSTIAHDKIYKKLEDRFFKIMSKLRGEFESLPACQSGGDVIDVAFNAVGSELSSSLLRLESKELKQIKRAMELIKMGQYGTCESCALKIPSARLEVRPYTTLCIKCQQKHEQDDDDLEDD